MIHEVRERIVRPATPEEKLRHEEIRKQIEEEKSELQEWSRTAALMQKDQVAIGTVFTAAETSVVEAIDDYAVKHAMTNRSAVVREALAKLLEIEIASR